VGDHRFLTVEVEGRLEKQSGEKKVEEEKKEGKRGWRREIRDIENFEELCRKEMQRWGEKYGKQEGISSEQAWKSWLETHDRIAK